MIPPTAMSEYPQWERLNDKQKVVNGIENRDNSHTDEYAGQFPRLQNPLNASRRPLNPYHDTTNSDK